MQQHIHTIVKHIFQKDSLQEVSEQALQQFTEEHPYASVGHWLLARKVHDTAKERYPAQAASSVTWFNNPLWLEWTLGDHEQVRKALVVPATTVKDTPPVAVTAPAAVIAPVEEMVTEAMAPAEVAEPEETIAPVITAPAVAVITTVDDIDDEETEILIPGVSEPVSLVEAPVLIEEPAVEEVAPWEEKVEETVEEEVAPIIESAPEVVAAPLEAPAVTEEFLPEVIETEHQGDLATELIAIGSEDNEPIAIVETHEMTAEETHAPVAAAAPATPEEKSNGSGQFFFPSPLIGAIEDHKTVSETEEPVFEPYHTIDYFASLGIKLKQEDMRDKLGQQLKSFTEWLRVMKKIAPVVPESTTGTFDETIQQSIQEIATHSVEGREVITEAMADVWAKQGNRKKAIAIYEKLSLLNPGKSAYFASRIDQLKA